MSELLSSITGGGGVLPQLAPDLTWPSRLFNNTNYENIVLDPSGSLTTALSLTGKYSIDLLNFTLLIQEQITIKLTIDSVIIWNDTYSVTDGEVHLFGLVKAGLAPSTMQCNESLLLEIETLTDTSVNFSYIARAIL